MNQCSIFGSLLNILKVLTFKLLKKKSKNKRNSSNIACKQQVFGYNKGRTSRFLSRMFQKYLFPKHSILELHTAYVKFTYVLKEKNASKFLAYILEVSLKSCIDHKPQEIVFHLVSGFSFILASCWVIKRSSRCCFCNLLYSQTSVSLGCVAVLSLGRLITMDKLVVMDTRTLYVYAPNWLFPWKSSGVK